jgi:hypothetical protein
MVHSVRSAIPPSQQVHHRLRLVAAAARQRRRKLGNEVKFLALAQRVQQLLDGGVDLAAEFLHVTARKRFVDQRAKPGVVRRIAGDEIPRIRRGIKFAEGDAD